MAKPLKHGHRQRRWFFNEKQKNPAQSRIFIDLNLFQALVL